MKIANQERKKLGKVVEWLGGGLTGKKELMRRLGYEDYNSLVSNWLKGGGWTKANRSAVLTIYRRELELVEAANKAEAKAEAQDAQDARDAAPKADRDTRLAERLARTHAAQTKAAPAPVLTTQAPVEPKTSRSAIVGKVLAIAWENPDDLEPVIRDGRIIGVRFK